MHPSIVYSMYYVAVVCPPQIDDKVLQFKNWMKQQFGCIVALKSPAHITLIPPFWMNEQREDALKQAMMSFKSDMKELEIHLDGFSHFDNRVLFINVTANRMLQELKNQVERHFVTSFADVIKIDRRTFQPHITIANRDLRPADFEKAWQQFSNKEFKETFQIKDISILRLKRSDPNWQMIHNNKW